MSRNTLAIAAGRGLAMATDMDYLDTVTTEQLLIEEKKLRAKEGGVRRGSNKGTGSERYEKILAKLHERGINVPGIKSGY